MQTIQKEGLHKPIFSWCPDIDEKTTEQMIRMASLPFAVHAALMPDAHFGQNMPIGGVLACEGVVLPDAVGSDAGCGMCAVQTSLKVDDFSMDSRWRYLDGIEKRIPVGFTHNDSAKVRLLRDTIGDKFQFDAAKSGIEKASFHPVEKVEDAYFEQIGTLGGGNHMAELDVDADGNVWILVHSGSRNIGTKLNDRFNGLAMELNRKFYSGVPEDICFLPTNTQEGSSYLRWMNFALMFAFRNRQLIVNEMQEAFGAEFPNVRFEKPINIHHNYAVMEKHFGKDLWVHRKGATLADKDTIGIIPGSMGTASYIVKGLGNPRSLNSCSHGAGRKFGRVDFNKTHNTVEALAAIDKAMEGIVYRKFKKEVNRKRKETGNIDVAECPFAYKDIDEVIKNEADLVEPVVRMTPIVVMKG